MKYVAKQFIIREVMDTSGVRFGTSGARGRVADMTNEVCFAYTAAFLQAVPTASGRVALAMDLRPSSPEIASACTAAIRNAGLEVDFCGPLPTPALALYAEAQNISAIMITGSHIPFDRNGIKFYSASGEITKADEARIADAVVALPPGALSVPLPSVNPVAWQGYVQRYVNFFPPRVFAGMTLGVYEHSSVARDLLRELLAKLGAEVRSFGRTDAFVPIDTEAVSQADIEQAQRWAEEDSFDAILSTDGDADRPLVGDESGNWFRGDITGILCAQYLEALTVVTTVSCNTAIERCGSFVQVRRTRIGSPYVIEGIEQLLAGGAQRVVGFEPNGGFLVGSPITKEGRTLPPLKTRDALLPMLCLLSMAREKGVKLSDLPRALPARFTASDRLQDFPTETSRTLIASLAVSHEAIVSLLDGLCSNPESIDQTDGLRITLADGEIVHFRPSGNAPELRCYAEANTQERARVLVDECLRRLRSL